MDQADRVILAIVACREVDEVSRDNLSDDIFRQFGAWSLGKRAVDVRCPRCGKQWANYHEWACDRSHP